jgi:UDP-N-acetylmuramyl pentapeptide phosphotransferase/UDP-N-acetylglucosamine-1-phosphate transferase
MIILISILFLLSFYSFFFFIKISSKFQLIDKANNLSVHKKDTPTGAGIIFLFIFYFFLLFHKFFIPGDLFFLQKNLYIFIISLSLLCFLSFYDDKYNVHPLSRLFFQVTIIFFCTSLFNLETVPLPIKFSIFLIIYFWVYTINIINFTDGVDGFLAINSLTFFCCIFLYFNFSYNAHFIYYISLIMTPVLLAYLFFNKPDAKIFMGDAGSIFIGFLIGFISIQTIILGRFDIIVSLLAYTYIDCSITILKKVFKKQYPWARLFDYYFLIPIKNKFSHKKVFLANCIYNLCIFFLVLGQIYFNIKYLFLISLTLAMLLLFYFKSFSKFQDQN